VGYARRCRGEFSLGPGFNSPRLHSVKVGKPVEGSLPRPVFPSRERLDGSLPPIHLRGMSAPSPIRGLHHVTATVTDAQDDLDFYVGVLGQRLVKKTVNFDNHSVYHFYYGNEAGSPGTIMTTFPYKGMGVRVGVKGAGQITVTDFSVPTDALDFWRERFAERKIEFTSGATPFGEKSLRVVDPSGLVLRLVGNDDDNRAPWTKPDIGESEAIRGIHAVTLLVREPGRTLSLLAELLGGSVIARDGVATRAGIGGGASGQFVDLLEAGENPAAVNGLGTVHHVALAIGSNEEQVAIRHELIRRGFAVTDVLDRQYFRSIYFREPNGVLFEIATTGPGFTADEPLHDLGRSLKLPPWEEPNRAEIEKALPAVNY
jgi:glyoxalase family protein